MWKDEQLFDIREYETSDRGKVAELLTRQMFDREEPEDTALVNGTSVKYSVTIQARDRGIPPLSTTCFFFVEITDINDNSPIFDLNEYRGRVLRSSTNARVLRVFAIDDDADGNADLTYSIVNDDDCSGCFNINDRTGEITTTSILPDNKVRT